MDIAIYTLTSQLHDTAAVAATTREFLDSVHLNDALVGDDYSTYGDHALDLIYVRTGGTEGVFERLLPRLQERSSAPIYLLTSGKSNSLAASCEILSYLNQRGIKGEIIHGEPKYIMERVERLLRVNMALRRLRGTRLGIIGQPSDWLISSQVAPQAVASRLGVELVNIEMQRLLDTMSTLPSTQPADMMELAPTPVIKASLAGAQRIYEALRRIVADENLSGLTLRCFDLLTAVRNTGCLALARLNGEGIVAGCEGDVPAMLSMAISQALTGFTGFQSNPATIDPETGTILMAHCTIPLNMVNRIELDTHYESGIGVGIRGYMTEGPVTLFKVSGDLSRHYVAQGTLVRNQAKADLCRTQQVIRLDEPAKVNYFLTCPIGNHHIVVPGHHEQALNELLAAIS